MSNGLIERRRRKTGSPIHTRRSTTALALKESEQDIVLRDLTWFVVDSDLSIPRIAELLRVSDVTLSMWIAGTTKPSTIKRCEIESFLQTRSDTGGIPSIYEGMVSVASY